MSEYAIKYKITRPGFFFSPSAEDTMVVKAENAQDAIKRCKEKVEYVLIGEVDLDEITFSVVDVRKV